MGQMTVQGVIYNKAMWTGPPGRPYTGTRGHRPGQGSLLGPWASGRVMSGFLYSGGRRSRAVNLSLWVATPLGGHISDNLHIRHLHYNL